MKLNSEKARTMREHGRILILLTLAAIAVRFFTSLLLQQPGYADAYYYAVGAEQLYRGEGFQEPFIWNYLDTPDTVPHPGFTYWMPLASLIGWLGLVLLGPSFQAMQMPFVLLSALLAPGAYLIAWDLTRERKHALLAGLLALFPGAYAHVLVLPETFTPFALGGGLCLWAAGRGLRDQKAIWFALAGLGAGIAHLTRADGLLLVGVVLLFAIFPVCISAQPNRKERVTSSAASLALAMVGYLLVMGPWFARNLAVMGRPLNTAGTATILLTTYDDLFAYDRTPTLEAYLAWGWGEILTSKRDALLTNTGRLWAEVFGIILLPFSALGAWRLCDKRILWPCGIYLPLLFLVMTLFFTFPGPRGALFHSASAVLPFVYATAGPGLELVLRWAVRRLPHWRLNRAWPVFSAGLVTVCLMVTLFLLYDNVLGDPWNQRDTAYQDAADWLKDQQAQQSLVMVGNPASYYWHTAQPAIMIPNEPLTTVLTVADRYGARYLLLDGSRPRTLDELYAGSMVADRLAVRWKGNPGKEQIQIHEIIQTEVP